jgi:hypothetical protein
MSNYILTLNGGKGSNKKPQLENKSGKINRMKKTVVKTGLEPVSANMPSYH